MTIVFFIYYLYGSALANMTAVLILLAELLYDRHLGKQMEVVEIMIIKEMRK